MFIHEVCSRPGAIVRVHQERAYDYDEKRGLYVYRPVDEDEEVHNLITDVGRVQIHTQAYGTGGLLTCGFNFIALSDDATLPSTADTVLDSELVGNGLDRVQGLVTLASGSGNQTFIENTFTYEGGSPQTVQKTALFTAISGGVMNHEIAFTQRTLFTNDLLAVTFTLTLG